VIPLRDNVPARRYPVVNVALIWLNFLFFAVELSKGRALTEFLQVYGVVPAAIVMGTAPLGFISLLTSMFLHGGWFHLLGNMLFLWIFGDNVEDRLGHLRYLFFYLLCGLVGGTAHVAVNPHSTVPTIGASGAIAGVLGAYFVLFPLARVATLVWWFFFLEIIELPALLFIGLWFLMQVFNGVAALPAASALQGGVAWWAHIGGFLAGFALVKVFCCWQPPPRRRYVDEYWPY